MTELNDFMTRIDLSVLNDYIATNGNRVVYAKGERIVQQGRLCRYVGVVKTAISSIWLSIQRGWMLREAYCSYLNMLVKTPSERFHELVSRYPGVTHNLPIQ